MTYHGEQRSENADLFALGRGVVRPVELEGSFSDERSKGEGHVAPGETVVRAGTEDEPCSGGQ